MKKKIKTTKSAETTNRIVEIRKARGLSSKDLAAYMDLSPSQMSRLENSKTPLSVKQILKLSAVLNVDTSEIVDVPLSKRVRASMSDDTLVGCIIGWLYEASEKHKIKLTKEQMSKFSSFIYKETAEQSLNMHETKYLTFTVVKVTKMNLES